jgi:branched-chain amino acid transport system permease protein
MAMKIINALITGLAQGSMIALVALGYTMVYGILKLINFAHSEVFMMGAFIGLYGITALGGKEAPLLAGVGGTLLAMALQASSAWSSSASPTSLCANAARAKPTRASRLS